MVTSPARLRELFAYDPETGILTRRVTHKRWTAGTMAGSLGQRGYVNVHVDGVKHGAHRVVWALVTGAWPTAWIDHIDGVRNNNRFNNLRDVPPATNSHNEKRARRHNATGFLGVHKRAEKPKPFYATIRVDGMKRHLGAFETAERAYEAYLAAKRAHQPGCTL